MLHEANLDEDQHAALELCLDRSKRLVGITGEAGTGKTSLLRLAYAHTIETNPDELIALVAPTGRAAKRIEEATGFPAKTIHRFLRWSMPADDDDFGLPAYSKDNRYPHKTIYVDESSMVNEELRRALIDAMPFGGIIRFFGDANQLPPVQGKSPFLDILERFPSVKLSKNYRSDDGVVNAARSILRNRIPEANSQFTLLNTRPDNLLVTADRFFDDTFRGMGSQLIIPTKVGKYGTFALNNHLQQKLNNKGPVLELIYKDNDGHDDKRRFRKGDKIIWTKNDYRLNLFNGMIGWVSDFDVESGDIILNIDDKEKPIPTHIEAYHPDGRAIFQYDPRKNIELAYAITTHKAQGSEFDNIVLLLSKSYVLNRANFYTAVTRAKKSVTVICGPGALATALRK